MPEIVLLAAAAVASYLGFALVALSQDRHWRTVADDACPPESGLPWIRRAGLLMLIICLALSLLRDGPAFGAVLCVFLSSMSGLAVAFTLTWRPRTLRGLVAIVRSLVTSSLEER